MSGFQLDDYVDVAERIKEFSAKFPEGSLQSELVAVTTPQSGWLCTAYAYRTPDDPKPGVGHAFEPVPGKTPYTKDSEAMNAETSAWGRAIVALGFNTKKIASKQEVQARHNDGFKAPETAPGPATMAGTDPGSVILTFGKHKGSAVKDVPRSYLAWWLGQEPPKNEAGRAQRAAVELYLMGATSDVAHEPKMADEDIPF